jgi:hypothetical protein
MAQAAQSTGNIWSWLFDGANQLTDRPDPVAVDENFKIHSSFDNEDEPIATPTPTTRYMDRSFEELKIPSSFDTGTAYRDKPVPSELEKAYNELMDELFK